ncbi:ATP-grasp domain-containing protein [Brachybacterium sp. YJGR34]|uniref:ATP-grasp domain-containing protein n=1 Tax=Brachybacterium sp. YJGR34 TaxID=2059911 RepID=UPI000E0BF946|nr:ATP-grasp domain-containing protein [Brachybacterium sp. YJGR34]
MTDAATIVIGSAGRRLYLVDWFRDALAALGLEGRIVVTENDPTSAAASYGDLARAMPRYGDPAYGEALIALVEELRPCLFLTVNDYELTHLHVETDLAEQLRARGVLVPGVSRAWQHGCADKLRMARLLDSLGVPTPATVLGDDAEGIAALAGCAEELVVKHRLGSGSSGLAIVAPEAAVAAVAAAAESAPGRRSGAPTRRDVVVQPRLPGIEHGVDIVGDLVRPGRLSAVLARRKVRMRAGETDQAVTVDASPFRHSAQLIADAAELTGLIDVDMFLDEHGEASVLDINPRFGGGYPFAHLAGADVPRFYVARALGIEIAEDWGDYATGVTAAKYESVRVTARGS